MNRKNEKTFILVIFALVMSLITKSYGQAEINGQVYDENGSPVVGGVIQLKPGFERTISNEIGHFKFNDIYDGEYVLSIEHLGKKTLNDTIIVNGNTNIEVSYIMRDDRLHLQGIVVTGTFEPRRNLNAQAAITVLGEEQLNNMVPSGTASLLQSIPGTFTDAAAGEVFTRVYARGISALAEDDLGWYYVSLQEDGLPVSLVQHSYYSPDIFHRVDIFTDKLEAVRGGKAAITTMNAPGGIFNFISKEPDDKNNYELRVKGGLQGEFNPFFRLDGLVGFELGKNWNLNVGGHYRRDQGARNYSSTFSKGGQIRFNLQKDLGNGRMKFYGKFLNDFTNRWNGVAATNWDDPQQAFGQDFNTTSLLMPQFGGEIPDGRNIAIGNTNTFDPSTGVHAKDIAIGLDFTFDIGNSWNIRFNTKYSNKSADWQTSISNAYISLNEPLAYFISGADFPVGEVVFRDIEQGEELARVDNTGIFGENGFEYISNGSLPNDGIMGTAAWFKENDADEWMGQFNIGKQWQDHIFNSGISFGYSGNSLFTQGSFAYVTYEPNPRMLKVTLENPGQPIVELSDDTGLSNYGGLFFTNSRSDVTQLGVFANDQWKLNAHWAIDLGLRYENISHQGSNDRFTPFIQDGGLDENPSTAYDNGILISTGEEDPFDFNYDYLSYSAGLNYIPAANTAIFLRFSSGNKAPELNYYYNNFSNVPINQRGSIERIKQAEFGFKVDRKKFALTSTLFWSELLDTGISNFEFDTDENTVFYTPVQFNDSRTIGLEWQSAYNFLPYFTFLFDGVVQTSEALNWTIYDSSNTVNIDDDRIVDFSGNELPFNPNLMFNVGLEFEKKNVNVWSRLHYMGEREANVENSFQLPTYAILNLGARYALSPKIDFELLTSNLLNSKGLTNFFGANTFGANANGASADFIQDNPDSSFIVVPVLPISILFGFNYRI